MTEDELVRSLAPLRLRAGPPRLGRRRRVATVILLAGALAAMALFAPREGPSWRVETLAGSPPCATDECRLAPGRWIETDGASRARVEVADIGIVELDPGTRLGLVATGVDEHRLDLARGRISARVVAPPRLLVVDTPAGSAVDLGCAYTLEVAGVDARLEVASGMVSLEARARASRVPAGAGAWMYRASGPGIPAFADASDALVSALARLDRGDAAALGAVLAEARPADTLSLWHLLQRVAPPERGAVWARIRELAGELPVDEAGLLRLDEDEVGILWVALSETW